MSLGTFVRGALAILNATYVRVSFVAIWIFAPYLGCIVLQRPIFVADHASTSSFFSTACREIDLRTYGFFAEVDVSIQSRYEAKWTRVTVATSDLLSALVNIIFGTLETITANLFRIVSENPTFWNLVGVAHTLL
jgi:hypothetical protein